MVGCLVWTVRRKKNHQRLQVERQETCLFFPCVFFSLQGKQAELELKKEVRLRLEVFFLGWGWLGWVRKGGKVKESSSFMTWGEI